MVSDNCYTGTSFYEDWRRGHVLSFGLVPWSQASDSIGTFQPGSFSSGPTYFETGGCIDMCVLAWFQTSYQIGLLPNRDFVQGPNPLSNR